MAGIADILGRLAAPVADDVARAAAEFGDDAVRSLMKTTPELRKRLASLAENRLSRWALRGTEGRGGLDNDFGMRGAEDLRAAAKYLSRGGVMDLSEDYIPRVGSFGAILKKSQEAQDPARAFELATRLRGRPAQDIVTATAMYGPKSEAAALEAIKDASRPAYENAVLRIASGEMPAEVGQLITMQSRAQRLSDVLQGLQVRGGAPRTVNMPVVSGQTELLSILRALGGAQ